MAPSSLAGSWAASWGTSIMSHEGTTNSQMPSPLSANVLALLFLLSFSSVNASEHWCCFRCIVFWRNTVPLVKGSFRKEEGPTNSQHVEHGEGETTGWHSSAVGRSGRALKSKDQMACKVVTFSFIAKMLRKHQT